MNELAPFVPLLAPELGARPGSHWTSVDGSMLSADISGFTALSEKLAAKGKAGAEEITELLNTCFSELIGAAYSQAGEVLKFGGDALLVLFRGDDHQVRSALAAIGMQRALGISTAARRSNLTMTVGVAEGPFDVFLVGEPRRVLLITGANASEVIELEGTAGKSGTLMSESIAAALSTRLTHIEGGGLVLDAIPPAERVLDQDLAPYVPGSLLEQLGAFSGLGGEHRLATVGFVTITGVDELVESSGGETVAKHLTAIINAVGDACLEYQVTFLDSDIAGSGAKLVLAAGAPLTTGSDEDAMLHAALAIAKHQGPLTIKIGVQRGRVFAGFLGSQYRRAYTVMGDSVNTAARFLGQAGPGDVIAGNEVVQATRTIFDADELEPFMVKGKSIPLVAHRVTGATDDVRRKGSATRLIGRSEELAILTNAIDDLGRVIELIGPAGVGKSSLLDEVRDQAEDVSLFQAGCSPYGAGSPYSLFRPLLRSVTGMRVGDSAEAVGRALKTMVADICPELLPMLPLLAIPFGADVAPTSKVDAIDPEFRRSRLHETVLSFLDATLDGSVLLVVEDVHWIDEASGDLLTQLIRAAALRPWSAFITRRDETVWSVPGATHVKHVEVSALGDDEIKAVAIDASTAPLTDAVLDLIVDRCDGNPMYAVELARSAAGADTLPDSVEGALTQRLDGLPPDTRRMIRLASVFGRQFDLSDVSAVSGDDIAFAVSDLDFVEHLHETSYRFAHAMYRDVAYEGLPYNERRRLHALVGTHLEGQKATTDPNLLSLHFAEGGVHAKAWLYGRSAGHDAAFKLAHKDAAVAYERALRSSRHLRVDLDDKRDVAASLGHSLAVIGEFESARKAFDQARRSNEDEVFDLELMRQIGILHERSGRLSAALQTYARAARKIPKDTDDPDLLRTRSLLSLARSGIIHRRGQQEECRAIARQALADAQRAEDPSSEALALERIHLATAYLHQPDIDGAGASALELFRQLGDRNAETSVLNNLGIQAYFEGDWTTARTRYAEAAAAAESCGNVVFGGSAALNGAEILSDQGHWDQAIEVLVNVQRNWEAAGYATGIAAAKLFAGVAQLRKGDLTEARDYLGDALERLQELGIQELIDDAASRCLELDVLDGTAGVPETTAYLERMSADDALLPRVRRVHSQALHAAGKTDEAVSMLAIPAGDTIAYDQALTLELLVSLVPDDPRAPEWRQRYEEAFAELGVERTSYKAAS